MAKRTIIMTVEKGGLKLPEVATAYRANWIAWMRRLVELQDTGFVKLFQKRIRISVVKLLNPISGRGVVFIHPSGFS